MGLFTSNCKECLQEITWFLEAPKNYHCRNCGTHNSSEEIEKSWGVNYDTYQKIMSYAPEHTKEYVMEVFKDDEIALIMLRKIYWPWP